MSNLAEVLSHKNPVYARDTIKFAEQLLGRARKLEPVLRAEYVRQIAETGTDVQANIWLRKTIEKISRAELNLAAYDDEIITFSKAKAKQCESLVRAVGFPALTIQGLLSVYGIECEEMYLHRYKKGPKAGQFKPGKNWEVRVSSDKWWRRKVRVKAARTCEQICRELGAVSKIRGAYVSDYSVDRWLESQRRNASLLDGMEAENDMGECFDLSKLAELGVSNPVIRRGELMVRIRGFEEWAERDSREWAALFITLTCPSKYHAMLSYGGRNPKYQGATPKEAQCYLVDLWARCRASLARDEVPYFGFRVVEPHHDGCPHWHMLLFVENKDYQPELLADTMWEYALQEDGDEPGAEDHRFTCVEIDREKGSAAGYIAKYIAKNIDGFAVGQDWDAERPATETAARVRAWASIWGINQFEQVGGAGVGIWRECRRLANHPEQMPLLVAPEINKLQGLVGAADVGDWSEFTERMGGAVCKRKDRPVQNFYIEPHDGESINEATGEVSPNHKRGGYGDPLKILKGIITIWTEFPLISRMRSWVVRFKNEVAKATDYAQAPPALA